MFLKFFLGVDKNGEIWFLPLENETTTFFANNFKIQGGQGPPLPPLPTPMVQTFFSVSAAEFRAPAYRKCQGFVLKPSFVGHFLSLNKIFHLLVESKGYFIAFCRNTVFYVHKNHQVMK